MAESVVERLRNVRKNGGAWPTWKADLETVLAELQAAQEREREAWQMIAAMLTENGGPFRVSRHSLVLAPRHPTLECTDAPDGSLIVAFTTPEEPSDDEGLEPIETSPLTEREPDL